MALAGGRPDSRRSRACAPVLALLGLALGGLLAAAPCFDAAAPQIPETQLRSSRAVVTQPKKPLSSYMLWVKENRARLESELGTKSALTVGKEAGRQWQEIGAGEKSKYGEKASELKRKYETELQQFLAAGGVIAKKPKAKVKAKRDPNEPKKPLSSYFQWLKDSRQRIVASLPAQDQKSISALGKAAGDEWKKVPDDEKRKYQDRYKADKVVYKRKLEEYRAGME